MKKSRGGRHRSSEEWRAILCRQADSGLTIREFCERESVCEQGFFRWRNRLGGEARAPRPRFVEVSHAAPTKDVVRVELQLPNGAILRIA